MSSLKQGYEHPVHDGVYAWVHLLNALTAIFLWFAATSRPFFPSFILLFLAYGFQLGLPLPSSRMSLSHGLDYSNIPLRLANLLLGIPELLRGRPEGLVVWLCISLLPAPLHFGLLIFDVRRLWKPMTPKEKANRILRQAQSRPALYRGYDDDETMSITQRLRRKWREFLKKCDQFYDRLEREEEAKKAESNRRSLNRGDDDFDVNRPLNAPSTGPSKPGTGILRQTTIELSPNTSGSSRSYSSSPSPSSGHHHQHHGRNSQFLSWITSRGKDAGRPGNTARPLQQKPSRTRQTPARTWGESLLDTYHEVKQDLTWYVSTTVEMAVIVVCRVMIPYLVIRGILRMADWATTVGLSQLVPDIREYLKGVLVMPTFKMPSLKMSSLWNKLDMDGRLAYVWESLARVFGPLWGMFRRSATWTTN